MSSPSPVRVQQGAARMTTVEALRGEPTLIPRMLVAGAIGNVLEWYDFAAYGYFASVFGRNFFPSTSHLISLLLAFGVFALGFMMRPIGSIIFGHIGDRHGRKRALMASVSAMAVSTFVIGLLPTYAQIGSLAPLMLILLRMVQGASVGGEYTRLSISSLSRARRTSADSSEAGPSSLQSSGSCSALSPE
jgi:MHS family proline/betaine transporter-like MFS transporter